MTTQKGKKNVDRTILGLTDFTKSSTNAILVAAHLFRDSVLKFMLLNAFETPDEKHAPLISLEDILTENSILSLKKQTTEISSVLKGKNLKISTHSIAGKLKKAISTIIRSENINLIVAGVPAGKYPGKALNTKPLLFMGENKVPVLLVPEKCPDKPIKSALIINLGSKLPKKAVDKEFEHIVNHDHIAKNIIYFNEKQTNILLHEMLVQKESDLIILIPAPGDRIDKALLEYQIPTLAPALASLLKY